VERVEYIKYMKITQRDTLYQIEINYNTNDESEYWLFQIKELETVGKTATGKLIDISCDGTDGIGYYDDANGTIVINRETNTVKVEIDFSIHRSEYHYVIVWKQ
jgi:hypothetical protein